MRADDLGAIPLKALMAQNAGVDWEAVDDVIFGCANQAGEDNRNVARMSALLAGLPVNVSGTTINRLCGSGMDAVITAARAIKAGEAELMIAGGVESMSRAPFVMPKAESAVFAQCRDLRHHHRLALRQSADEGAIWRRFHAGDRRERRRGLQGLARRPGRLRACAARPRRSRRRRTGGWRKEIVPVTIPQRKGDPVVVDKDEHPRADTTMEALAKLRTPFKQEGGTVTAGNASGVNDGAAALIIASEAAAQQIWPDPDRPHRRRRRGRRAAAHHGHRPDRRHPQALRAPGHFA